MFRKLLLINLMFANLALAQEATIEWSPVDRADAYNIYSGEKETSLVKTNTVTATKFKHTVSDTICFAVTATNKFGESGLSETLCLGKPQAPTGLSYTVQVAQ